MWHHADKEQVDQLKQWWRAWGRYLFLAIIIGAAVGVGWRQWGAHLQRQSQRAAGLYAQLTKQQTLSLQLPFHDQLKKHYSGTVYAVLSDLFMAKSRAMQQQWQAAYQDLQSVSEQKRWPEFQQLSRLQMAKIDYQLKRYAQGVSDLKAPMPMFEAAAAHLRGELWLAQGNVHAARKAFVAATQDYAAAGMANPLLARQLAALPPSSTSSFAGLPVNHAKQISTRDRK